MGKDDYYKDHYKPSFIALSTIAFTNPSLVDIASPFLAYDKHLCLSHYYTEMRLPLSQFTTS
jgi:hypothetical protein